MRTGIWVFPDAPAPELVDAIVRAERSGLDEFWIGDEGPARDPFSVLAAAALLTHRIRLGVGVTNPYLRHPAMTASVSATIHELSDGRMVIGLGAGGRMALQPVGVKPTTPLTDCRRAVAIMRAVLEGRSINGYAPPAHAMTSEHLPIVIGARGERFNRWASAEADGVFVAGVPPVLVPEVVGWARSVSRIDVGVYVSACLVDEEFDEVRPRMIHAFADAPPRLREIAGLDDAAVARAALALDSGDPGPARALMADGVVDLVLARRSDAPARLAALARELRPDAVGLAVLGSAPIRQVDMAAEVLEEVRDRVAATSEESPR